MLIDSAVYADGQRIATTTLEACQVCSEPGKFAWIVLHEPTREEFASVAGKFGLDEMAVQDAIEPHQRSKIERYEDRLFVVLKPARYIKDTGRIEFGEIHAFVDPDFIITILYGEDSAFTDVRQKVESEPERLRRGPATILYEILHQVVEGYAPVVESLENDLDEVEAEVLGGDAGGSRRIHELSREVIRLHQATQPLAGALERLTEDNGDLDPETRKYLRRARDRVLRVTERTEGFREILSSVIGVNLTMVGVRQNDQMQKMSAWGAILIVPTLIAGIFGMNFEEAWWIHAAYGFEVMVGLILLISLVLYWRFKRSGWL